MHILSKMITAGVRSHWRALAYALVPTLGALATWLSGIVETSPAKYGFPLPWKTLVWTGEWYCPGGSIVDVCILVDRSWHMLYSWGAFVLDVGFYIAIGYGLVLGSVMVLRVSQREPLHPLDSLRKLSASDRLWKTIFLLFAVASILWVFYLLTSTATLVYNQ